MPEDRFPPFDDDNDDGNDNDNDDLPRFIDGNDDPSEAVSRPVEDAFPRFTDIRPTPEEDDEPSTPIALPPPDNAPYSDESPAEAHPEAPPIDDSMPRFEDSIPRLENGTPPDPDPDLGLDLDADVDVNADPEEVLEDFIAATRERWEPPPPQRRETAPPPETQSAFVNPALARISAARPSISRREVSEIWLALRTIFIVMLAGLVVSFIFSYWTPESFFSQEFVANLQEVSSTQGPPTPIPSPLPTFASVQSIGIITGHAGPPLNPQFSIDPGAVCDENGDGIAELTELDINTTVALRLANLLVEDGYVVDLLNEWDPRLEGYRASVLVSIHTNTCENLGFGATGFNVQTSSQSAIRERDQRLGDCLAAEYANSTGLSRHFGSPPDLVDYHVFREVSLDTPTAIVELGFMFADRNILTQQPDVMAQGIYEGLNCFLSPNTFVPTQPPPP